MQPIIQPCARCKQTYNRLKLWMHYANESSQVGTFGQNFEKKNLFWKTNHGFLIVKTPVKCYQALKCPTITLWLTSLGVPHSGVIMGCQACRSHEDGHGEDTCS